MLLPLPKEPHRSWWSLSSSEPLKALGVSRDLTSDHFRFVAPGGIFLSPDPMTKRSLLSLASKMFAPLGLISAFTVRAKILFQELWLKGLLWDDPLDSEVKAKWLHWKSEFYLSDRCRYDR